MLLLCLWVAGCYENRKGQALDKHNYPCTELRDQFIGTWRAAMQRKSHHTNTWVAASPCEFTIREQNSCKFTLHSLCGGPTYFPRLLSSGANALLIFQESSEEEYSLVGQLISQSPNQLP